MTSLGISVSVSARRAGTSLGLVAGCLAALGVGSAHAADIQWVNEAGGSWGQAANWSPPQVPAKGDRALISLAGSYVVTVAFADVPVVDELVVGGAAGEQMLLLADDTSVTATSALRVETSGVIRIEVEAVLTAYGVAENRGRIEATTAQIHADLGLANAGTIELTDSRILGVLTNAGTLQTTGMVSLTTVINEPGASIDVRFSPGLFPGAIMDTLINRGHVVVRAATNLVAGALIANQPFAVLALEGGATINGESVTNAGLLRVGAGASAGGLVYEQLASGELEAHYSTSAVQFAVLCQTIALDGTVSPVFEPGFEPASGNLPLVFGESVSGRFAILNPLGTGGRAVEALYLVDSAYLRVVAPGIAIFPSFGGGGGPITATITGSELVPVVATRLRRSGESDIVADPLAQDPDTGMLSARFDLAGRAHGTWDVVLEGAGGAEETAVAAFTIGEIVRLPIRVEMVGRDRLRRGGASDWSIAATNPGNEDVVGSIQLVVPPGLAWVLRVERPGSFTPTRLSGQFEDATTLIVPGVVASPGINLTGVTLNLRLPMELAQSGGTLQARWVGP